MTYESIEEAEELLEKAGFSLMGDIYFTGNFCLSIRKNGNGYEIRELSDGSNDYLLERLFGKLTDCGGWRTRRKSA